MHCARVGHADYQFTRCQFSLLQLMLVQDLIWSGWRVSKWQCVGVILAQGLSATVLGFCLL